MVEGSKQITFVTTAVVQMPVMMPAMTSPRKCLPIKQRENDTTKPHTTMQTARTEWLSNSHVHANRAKNVALQSNMG